MERPPKNPDVTLNRRSMFEALDADSHEPIGFNELLRAERVGLGLPEELTEIEIIGRIAEARARGRLRLSIGPDIHPRMAERIAGTIAESETSPLD